MAAGGRPSGAAPLAVRAVFGCGGGVFLEAPRPAAQKRSAFFTCARIKTCESAVPLGVGPRPKRKPKNIGLTIRQKGVLSLPARFRANPAGGRRKFKAPLKFRLQPLWGGVVYLPSQKRAPAKSGQGSRRELGTSNWLNFVPGEATALKKQPRFPDDKIEPFFGPAQGLAKEDVIFEKLVLGALDAQDGG